MRKTAVIVVVLAVIAGGLWWWLKPAPVVPGAVFVGDSVTYMSSAQLERALGSKHPRVLARSGYRSDQLLTLLQREVETRKKDHRQLRQVALLVGYNDVLQDKVEGPALTQLMDVANEFDCAVWLTLPPVPMREDLSDRWNERVRALAKAHPHVHVSDEWRDAVRATQPGDLVKRSDGVHPNEAGAERLTQVFTEAIEGSC